MQFRLGPTRRQFLAQAASAAAGLYILPTARAATGAFPQPGAGSVPASVNKVTVAVDLLYLPLQIL